MLEFERIRAALSFVESDDRDVWVRMGMAIKSELGSEGFVLWDEWSRQSGAYQPAAAKAVWKSFKHGGRISIASLFHAARDAGWREDVEHARPSPEEVERRRAEHAARAVAEQVERDRRAKIAAMRASALWASAQREGVSPYLLRKGVEAESVRFLLDGSLVLPMLRYDHPRETALVGAQVIDPKGEKRFTPGTAKQGSACRLGLVSVGHPVLLCEGLATGLTIRMAINRRFPVFVAFDAGNLLPVAEMLRALHPDSPLLVCADDDWHTKGNPGLSKARLLTRQVPLTHLIYPIFSSSRAEKHTDFNDLHAAEGLTAVARQFFTPLAHLCRLSARAEALQHVA